MRREPDRHTDGTDTRSGAQEAETPGTEIEDVAGKDRHQRHRTAEQDREEIERYRTQNHLFGLDVAETGGDRLPALGGGLRAGRGPRDGKDHERGCQEEADADGIGNDGAERIDQAAGNGADDHRRLPGRGIPGDRIG
ncbi:hypothetical protein D9M72_533130 [compost metagenome]